MNLPVARMGSHFRALQAQHGLAAALRWGVERLGRSVLEVVTDARLFAHDPHLRRVLRRSSLPDNERYPGAAFMSAEPAGEQSVEPASVAVVVPVYGDAAATALCLNSVLAAESPAVAEVIVVDDASPDAGLVEYVERLAASGQVRLVRNVANEGFVASVNRGMRLAGRRDVVLLNSDTEVHGDWADRLAAHARRDPRVATVTPFSNNGTICTYPSPQEPGELPPGETVSAVDLACREACAQRACVLPTGVGFCMFVRRDCLDEAGLFDAGRFGRGYGEETEFCLRTSAAGWLHLLATDVFVRHQGEASFGAAAADRRAVATARLNEEYPAYLRSVERFLAVDPPRPYRVAATAARFKRSGRPVVLMIQHALGTGTERHVMDLCRHLQGRAHTLILEGCEPGVVRLRSIDSGENLDLRWRTAGDAQGLEDLLRSFGVTRAHVHHTLGLTFDVRGLIKGLGVPFDVSVHDYYAVCPRIRLTDPRDGYCGGPREDRCDDCLARQPRAAAAAFRPWRQRYRWLLEDSDRVICPSRDAAVRIAPFVDGPDVVIVPHDQLGQVSFPTPSPEPLHKGERLRVAVLGVLTADKGLRQVADYARLVSGSSQATAVDLIGFTPDEEAWVLRGTGVKVTGPYQHDDLGAHLRRVRPHVVWFPAVWPETYSYTLSEAMLAGAPVVASDLGAFRERLEGRPWSWLVRWDASPEEHHAVFAAVAAQLRAGEWQGTWMADARARNRVIGAGADTRSASDFYDRHYLATEPGSGLSASPAT